MFLLRDDISEIVTLLRDGKVICYPTDTIWGIGCDIFDEQAVSRIGQIKGRPSDRGYILLVSDLDMLKRYVPKLHPRIETLLSFHQRPLTVVYDHSVGIPASVKAPNGSVAIRVATDQFCQELIAQLNSPLLSTSANETGEPFPAHFGAISSEILKSVDYVVKHRQDDKSPGEPSAVARLDRHLELEFLRE